MSIRKRSGWIALDQRQAFRAACCRQHDEIERHQHFAHQFAVILIVIDDDDRPARAGIAGDLAHRGQGGGRPVDRREHQADAEGRALVALAVDDDFAAERLGQKPGDGQPESKARHRPDMFGLAALEGLENARQVRLAKCRGRYR